MKKIIIILIFLGIISCNEIVKFDNSKPLSQKQQIIKMIDKKIKYSNDAKEKEILKDLKYSIIARIKDKAEVK